MVEHKYKVPIIIFNSMGCENVDWLFKTIKNTSVKSLIDKEFKIAFSRPGEIIVIFNVTSENLFDIDLIKEKFENFNTIYPFILTKKEFFPGFSQIIRSGFNKIYFFPDEQFILRRDIELTVENILQKKHEATRESLLKRIGFENIIGKSEAIQKCIELAKKVSKASDANVLLLGETGTGKELFARAIHYNSSRANYQFVEVNTSAIPESLFESELFGYEKGAFTDAKTSKIGLFELANRGTIFFDEIGDLNQALQVKLLRVIETKVIRHLGGIKDINIDCRILAATNQELEKLISLKKFREDLYYRLNVMEIHLPPLRERVEDIIPIAENYIKILNSKYNKEIEGFTKEAKKKLINYNWPGNVRELQNVVERSFILSNSKVIREDNIHIGIESVFGSVKKKQIEVIFNLDESNLKKLEKKIVEEVLKHVYGNKSLAAKKLGISRPSLLKILNEI